MNVKDAMNSLCFRHISLVPNANGINFDIVGVVCHVGRYMRTRKGLLNFKFLRLCLPEKCYVNRWPESKFVNLFLLCVFAPSFSESINAVRVNQSNNSIND